MSARDHVNRALELAGEAIIERMAREDRRSIPEAARAKLRNGVADVGRNFDDAACERLALVPLGKLAADIRAMIEPDCRKLCAPLRAS